MINTVTNIIITTQFEATHFWKHCNIPEVEFLKYPHRHIFHVKVKLRVHYDDRDKEFIVFKRFINEKLQELKPKIEAEGWSCEMIARYLLETLDECVYACVMEDNENGAEIVLA